MVKATGKPTAPVQITDGKRGELAAFLSFDRTGGGNIDLHKNLIKILPGGGEKTSAIRKVEKKLTEGICQRKRQEEKNGRGNFEREKAIKKGESRYREVRCLSCRQICAEQEKIKETRKRSKDSIK